MENLINKGNEIKEQGFFGKTVYVIKNNEIREPGLFGRTVYVIKGNEIKEPGFLGKTVYIIDGDTIKTPGVFGGAFLGTVVAKTKEDGRIIKKDNSFLVKEESEDKSITNEDKKSKNTYSINISIETSKDETKKIGSYIHNGIVYNTISKTENGYTFTQDIPEYNEVLVFYTFLSKYPIIKRPDIMKDNDYSYWTFSKIGISDIKSIHKKLFIKGFYSIATNEEVLSTYNIAEIKNIIAKLGLNIKGKKQDLISGLISHVEKKVLAENLVDGYNSISIEGKQWMAQHKLEFAWYNEQEKFSTLEEYKKHIEKPSNKQEIIEKLYKEIELDQESFGRYIYDELVSIYNEDNNKESALVCLLKELLIDISGSFDYASWKKCGFDKEIIDKPFQIIFTPYLLRTLPKYKNYFVDSLIDKVYEITLPINICDKKMFKEILIKILNEMLDVKEQKKYQTILNDKLIKSI